ncbi:MAG: hypothetical protein J7502_13875, partial [Flavisolibacter sp.]|nr:hypothetical protein [Flavisolibacter sp.]
GRDDRIRSLTVPFRIYDLSVDPIGGIVGKLDRTFYEKGNFIAVGFFFLLAGFLHRTNNHDFR